MDHSVTYEFSLLGSANELSEGSIFCGTNQDGEPVLPEYVVELVGENSVLIERMIGSPWDIDQLNKLAASGLLRIKRPKMHI